MECPEELGLSDEFCLILLTSIWAWRGGTPLVSDLHPVSRIPVGHQATKSYKEHLGMTPTSIDPCLFHKRDEHGIEGLAAMQVDDSLLCGTAKLLSFESESP